MATYLFQVSYTSEAIQKLITRPENRGEVVRKAVEGLGGKLTGAWLSFGDFDVVVLAELPDNVTAASLALAVGAGGSCKAIKTTPLLSIEQGTAALQKAGSSQYKPIGSN